MEQGPDELSEREESRDEELDRMTNQPLDKPGPDEREGSQQGGTDSQRTGG